MTISLHVLEGPCKGASARFEKAVVGIGREAANDFPVDDIHVSGFHGRFTLADGRWRYEDLRSTNGSAVLHGDEKVAVGQERGVFTADVAEGDLVLIGSARRPVVIGVSFRAGDAAAAADGAADISTVARIRDLDRFKEGLGGDADALGRLSSVLVGMRWELDLQDLLASTAAAVFSLLPKATHLAIALRDGPSGAFIPMRCAERDRADCREGFQVSQTIMQKVSQEKAAVLVANAPEEVGETESIIGAQILATMAAPLWKGEEITGVIQVDNRRSPQIFRQADLRSFLVLASQISLAIRNAVLFEKLSIAEAKLEGENRYLKGEQERQRLGFVRCASRAMQEVYEKADKVKETKVTVLIEGETGTGKEVVASLVHYTSVRRDKLFVAVNCAAVPETLLESELFGHRKGAFTGADRDKKGLFETAEGGSLFLDEVTEMPLALQGKLLRALQEGEVRPLGAAASRKVDVRVIAASNRDIQKEVGKGRFREDLFYRLNVFPIRVPPLRERRDDIPPLCDFLLRKYCAAFGKTVGGLSQEASDALVAYDWPGNIRELENEVQRLVLIADEGQIVTTEHLSSQIRRVEKLIEEVSPEGGTLRARMEEVEKWILINALKENGGNKSMTARSLGISREGLHKKLAKLGL